MAVNARPVIGMKDVVYAVLTESSDVSGGTPTYGTVKTLAGSGKISINPNAASAILYGDDQPLHVAESTGKIDVSVDFADIDPAAEAELLGHTYTAGGVLKNSSDQSPYVALGFKTTRTGSSVATYTWLYKGKFTKPDASAETKRESINFQSVSMSAQFVPLIASGNYMLKVRTDDTAAASSLISGFFSTVVLSASADLTAFTLSSGAGNSTAKTITLTFSKATSTNVVGADASNVVVILDSNHAVLTPTAYTPGTAGTSPTLTLTFGSLTSAAHTVAVLSGLKDTNGVSVTAKSIAVTPS